MSNWIEFENNEPVINAGALLKMLLNKMWVIAIATILSGAIMFAYASLAITPLYKSSIMMYVNNRTDSEVTPKS